MEQVLHTTLTKIGPASPRARTMRLPRPADESVTPFRSLEQCHESRPSAVPNVEKRPNVAPPHVPRTEKIPGTFRWNCWKTPWDSLCPPEVEENQPPRNTRFASENLQAKDTTFATKDTTRSTDAFVPPHVPAAFRGASACWASLRCQDPRALRPQNGTQEEMGCMGFQRGTANGVPPRLWFVRFWMFLFVRMQSLTEMR